MDLGLQGKRALVTGSSSGIGATIADLLAQEGVRVVVHGRRDDAARAVAEGIGGPDKAVVVLGDIAEPAEAERVAREAVEAFGGIDILINNAGGFGPSNWDETNPDEWTALYRTNVSSAVSLSAALAPPMKERGWGRIIQIGSATGALAMPNSPVYAATKAALANMSSSLAKHYGEFGITSNLIGVGTIATAWMRNLFPQTEETKDRDPIYEMMLGAPSGNYHTNPIKRMGLPEEVAYAVMMLASPRAAFINGVILRVDGGMVPNIGL